MKKYLVVIVLLILLLISSAYYNRPSFKVATFNLDNFGKPKAENQTFINQLSTIISQTDIIALQEIRSSSGSIPGNCLFSEKLGRTNYKEQYGFCFSKRVISGTVFQYNDSLDVFEREPFAMNFSINGFSFVVINIHIRPDSAYQEIAYLPVVVSEVKRYYAIENIILLGDLNADCSYFQGNLKAITDIDTTTSASNCAYDRIISDLPVRSMGIFDISISDHYPLWAEFYLP